MLDEEIDRLEAGGKPAIFEPWQVNERYARVLEDARTLVSDFRQVEENFRQLAQDVVEHQTSTESTKGEIVNRVLDSHDSVRESPQGRSFYGFERSPAVDIGNSSKQRGNLLRRARFRLANRSLGSLPSRARSSGSHRLSYSRVGSSTLRCPQSV